MPVRRHGYYSNHPYAEGSLATVVGALHICRVSNILPPADPHATLRQRVLHTAWNGEGHSAPGLRQAAATGAGLPPELLELVDKIHRHAYRVTAEEVAALQARYGDDPLFEIIVSAALGASEQRLAAALSALEEACD